MRRVCAFIIFDITGDPPLDTLCESIPAALSNMTLFVNKNQHTVIASMVKDIGFLSPAGEKPRPDPEVVPRPKDIIQ